MAPAFGATRVAQIFTAGSTLVEGDALIDPALTDEAIRLAERLHRALPRDSETVGLLALMLLVDARTPARTRHGDLVPLAEQDRSTWKHAQIERAVLLLEQALAVGDRLADRICVMRDGRIVEMGDRDDPLRRPGRRTPSRLICAGGLLRV